MSSDDSSSAYIDDLKIWLGQAYHWQTLQMLPFIIPQHLYTPNVSTIQNSTYPTRQETRSPSVTPAAAADPPLLATGRIYEIPRLSKRLLAEVIDFGLLFFIKALVTLAVLENWNLDDSSLFETETGVHNNEDEDYELTISITTNLLLIEMFHRILVIFYEVYFTFSGGTPGKRTIGLKIVSCQRCIPVGESRILVQPGTEPITLWKSIGRAFLKNFGTALLFPTFLMFVQNNRTLYDILCGTVVVETDN